MDHPPPKLAILADDLTGACDAAAPFAARGHSTVVLLEAGRPWPGGVEIVSVDLDSRHLGRRTAARRHAEAARVARAAGVAALFKKVDSTLRGHALAEALACRRGWGAPLVVLCPAFPALGRRVIDGRLLVDGRGDLGAAVDLLGVGGRPWMERLPLPLVQEGPVAVAGELRRLVARGVGVAIADAARPEDLAVLVAAAERIQPRPLLAGSGGLATALAAAAGSPSRPVPDPGDPGSPWLVIVGSQTPVAAAQVAALEAAGAALVRVPAEDLVANPTAHRAAAVRVARALADGAPVVLRLVAPGATPALPRDEERMARALGRVAHAALRGARPVGLFLTGGSTARACLRALAVFAIALNAEPLPGIAAGRAVGGLWDGRRVLTKSGGFGDPETIVRLVMAGRRVIAT